MAIWPLISRQEAFEGNHSHTEPLSLFYMNDYSRPGLWVASCDDARRVLAESRFGVVQDGGSCHVILENADEVQAAVALLNDRGVTCEIADVAGQIYRG